MKKVAVIGGGITGLAAAYELVKVGFQVTIFESSHRLGGLSAGFKKPDWDWSVEEYYHHWFQSDHFILSLVSELGWRKKIRFSRPKTVVYDRGNFFALDSPLTALLFPGFSLIDKARFGLVTFYLRYLTHWQSFEKQYAHTWLHKYYGSKLYETLYEQLLIGKFSQYYQQVNMAWFWARFKSRTTQLGTFEGGFQAFIDLFLTKLIQLGVQVKLNSPVKNVESLPDNNLLVSWDSFSAKFNQVLVTTSPYAMAKMTPTLEKQYLAKLLNLKSIGAVVLILSIKHQLSRQGYYWFNLPKSAGFPFLALVEHTNFIPSDYFSGEHILYCGDYLDPNHEYFKLSKDELLLRFLPSLQLINSDFNSNWVNESWLFRNPYAQPIPLLNHSANIPELNTPIPNLYFASMSQIYPWDRGTNYAVELAQRAVTIMCS